MTEKKLGKPRNQAMEKRRRISLYKTYGELIDKNPSEIPDEHRCKLNGGLRCFGQIHPRDKVTGLKIWDKTKRCGSPASNSSLYCAKCGGGNTSAMVTAEYSIMNTYKKHYRHEFNDVLEAFLNDPKITDLRPELAHARAVFMNFVKMLQNAQPKSPRRVMRTINEIVQDKEYTDLEKYLSIKEIIEQQTGLTDGRSIDRINRTIDLIGKTIERMWRIQSKAEYMYTQDGMKIILRAIIEVIQKYIADPGLQIKMREEFLALSTITKGDISKLENDTKVGGETVDLRKQNDEEWKKEETSP